MIMRHVDGYSMERITEKLGYSSRQAIYNQYNKALAKFVKLWDCKCAGMDKMRTDFCFYLW